MEAGWANGGAPEAGATAEAAAIASLSHFT